MEILVAILIIALIAVVAFFVMQRRPRGGIRDPDRAPATATPTVHRDRIPRNDPMAVAVAEHAEAMDPQDVIVAEERMRAQARQVAAGLQAENRTEHESYAQDPRLDGTADPAGTNEYADADDYVYPPPPGQGYVDPNSDRRR